ADIRLAAGREDLRRERDEARGRTIRIGFEIGERRHRLVVEIEPARPDHRPEPPPPPPGARRSPRHPPTPPLGPQPPPRPAPPPRSAPPSASLHHCSRISPATGSRTTSRTRATSTLKA